MSNGFTEVELQKLQHYVILNLHKAGYHKFANSVKFNIIDMLGEQCVRLLVDSFSTHEVVAIEEDIVTKELEYPVPANWFEHLKMQLGIKNFKTIPCQISVSFVVEKTIKTYKVCPHLNIDSQWPHISFMVGE